MTHQSAAYRYLLRGLIACTPLLSVQALADSTVTAKGYAYCYDGTTQSYYPMDGIRVELMDSDCDGSEICDDEMGRSRVQADGSFSVTGSGGDPGWIGSDPDVYLRFVYNDDQGVRLTNELDSTRSWNTPEHDHDNTGDGTVDFGSWSTGNGVDPGEGTQCGVWRKGRIAFQSYISEIGAVPPAGHLDIEYWSAIYAGTPWTNTDTIHWPIHYGTSVMFHEFGHSIRHAADGDGGHFTNDVVKYRYARNHPDGCAADDNAQPGELLESVIGYNFNEGWADYWANDVGGCGAALTDRVELQVAAQLYAYQKAGGLTRANMVSVLVAHPGTIHSLDEFSDALRQSHFGISTSPLKATAAQAGVNYIPYTEARRASLIAAQISQINRQISALRHQALVYRSLSGTRAEGPCKNCEDIFKRVVAPVLLQGESKALEIRLSALKRAATPDWAQQVQREINTGHYDAFIEKYRSDLRGAMRQVFIASIGQAQIRLRQIQSRFSSAAFDASLSTLAKARGRLEPQAAGAPGAVDDPLGWLPQVSLSDDRAHVAGSSGQPSSALAPKSLREVSLSIPANVKWVDTGIVVSRGQHIAVTAHGTWSNSGAPTLGPKGFQNYKYPGTILANADLASLIAKVDEVMFAVGGDFDGASPATGKLYLSINDTPDTYEDNQGALSVQVSKY